ncbi:MAG: pyrroline-5-carboxylate reductase [Chloroflexota bacterium]|nr:pyrroline-5-carboxylate reductase [Chloroflexota bacterium]
MKIAFIGAGVMGEAMMKGILDKGIATRHDLTIADVRPDRLSELKHELGVGTSEDNRGAAEGAQVVVLAVKPQSLDTMLHQVEGALLPGQLVLSIIAGSTIATISRGLRHEEIVRAMPNTPARIGQGMTVWTASQRVTEAQRGMARSILGALGHELCVPDEDMVDMATAVSGSGPAYILLVMEALVAAAADIGLPQDIGRELVTQTVKGAACLAQKSDAELAELRENVTSPGGTTERGLMQLEEGGVREAFSLAVLAAYRRAKELGC